jgi:thiol peroxidase
MERKGAITFKGNPMTLEGPELRVGDPAPDFTALDNEMKPVSLKDFEGSVVVLSVVPSVDTPVCEIQTKRFNKEAEGLDADVLTVSMDLPFAQRRFKEEHGIKSVYFVSDFKDHAFGRAWGVYVKELGLLARAVFVVDREGKIAYRELVREMTEQPDYGRVLEAVKQLAVRSEGC